MKFSTRSTYTIAGTVDPVAAYEKNCIENRAFYRGLYDALGSDVNVKSEGTRDGKFVRESIVHLRPEAVPTAIKAVLGADGLDYRETMTYDPSTRTGTIKDEFIGSALRGKVSAKSGFSLRSAAHFAPCQVVYEANNEVTASMWLIGGQVEKTMAGELQAKIPEVESFSQAWLDRHVTEQPEQLAARAA